MKFNKIEEKSFLKKIIIYLKIDSKFGFILAFAFATISIALYFYQINSDSVSWAVYTLSDLFFWGNNGYLEDLIMNKNENIDYMQIPEVLSVFVFIASMILKTILIYYIGKFLESFYYKKKLELAEKPSKERKKIIFKKIMLWFSRIGILWIFLGPVFDLPIYRFGIDIPAGLGGFGAGYFLAGIYFFIALILVVILAIVSKNYKYFFRDVFIMFIIISMCYKFIIF